MLRIFFYWFYCTGFCALYSLSIISKREMKEWKEKVISLKHTYNRSRKHHGMTPNISYFSIKYVRIHQESSYCVSRVEISGCMFSSSHNRYNAQIKRCNGKIMWVKIESPEFPENQPLQRLSNRYNGWYRVNSHDS